MKQLPIFLLFLLGAVLVLAADVPSDRMTRVEHGLRPAVTIEGDTLWTLEERMRHYEVPAVSIAVIEDFEVVDYRVYGVADRETGEKATRGTLFQAGSVSKPVAAFGALKMVADGKLTLDGDINDTLKSWELSDNELTTETKLTLNHLLSHTGGVTVHGFPGYAVGEDVPTTIQVLDGSGPANTPPIRVNRVPGEGYRYSGGGYTIAQQMMEDAADKPFPALMGELVLDPVGMERSTFLNPLPRKLLKRAAAGYRPDHSAVEGKRHTYPEMAAAGLWTTAEDLARFAIEVQIALRGDSDVLDSATAEQLVEPVTDHYGRGFHLARRDGAPYFSHGGWDEGFCARLTAHRTEGYGAVVMINSNHPQLMDEIIRSIGEEYDWAGYGTYPKLEMQQAALELYPGRYRYNDAYSITIERSGDLLFMQQVRGADTASCGVGGGEAQDQELLNVGNGRYIRRERNTPIEFTVEDSVVNLHLITGHDSRQSHQRMADDERTPRDVLLEDGYDKALPVYRKLFEQSHLSEQWLNGQGLGLAGGKQYEPAIDMLRIATELYPDSANTWDSVGHVYRRMGRLDQALQWYRKSLGVDPEFPSAVEAVAELEAEWEGVPFVRELLHSQNPEQRARAFGVLRNSRNLAFVPLAKEAVRDNPDDKQVAPLLRVIARSKGQNWATVQMTVEPDTPFGGDSPTAWHSKHADMGEVWIELDYATAVTPEQVRIHETFNPGAVKAVLAKDGADWTPLWSGVAPAGEAPHWFEPPLESASLRTRTLRIELDTSRQKGWNEIDAVELIGDGKRQWAQKARTSSSFADEPEEGRLAPPVSFAAGETSANTLTIRALIDGSDVVKVRGNTLWYEHRQYAMPGAWVDDSDHSGNEPTFVNGVEWLPQWVGKNSRAYTAAGGLLPADRAVTVMAVGFGARGAVAVLEQPSEKNDYTLSVLLDDPPGGAEWYEVQLRW